MLPDLRRFIAIFHELETRHGQSFIAAYTNTLYEAQTLLQKVDGDQKEEGRETTEPPPADKQNVTDFPQRRPVATA